MISSQDGTDERRPRADLRPEAGRLGGGSLLVSFVLGWLGAGAAGGATSAGAAAFPVAGVAGEGLS
jgi:hypothetical protein